MAKKLGRREFMEYSALIITSAALTACEPPKGWVERVDQQKINNEKFGYLEGIVLEESDVCGGEGQLSYALKVETDKGVYTFSVIGRGGVRLDALSLAIDVGDRIAFPTTGYDGYPVALFNSDRIGEVTGSYVRILREGE